MKKVTRKSENLCPECGEPAEIRCKCPRSDSRCKNGHKWHKCFVHHRVVPGHADHSKPMEECTCPAEDPPEKNLELEQGWEKKEEEHPPGLITQLLNHTAEETRRYEHARRRFENFFYLLLRDHMPAGVVEKLIDEVLECPDRARSYSNHFVYDHVQDILVRMIDGEKTLLSR